MGREGGGGEDGDRWSGRRGRVREVRKVESERQTGVQKEREKQRMRATDGETGRQKQTENSDKEI